MRKNSKHTAFFDLKFLYSGLGVFVLLLLCAFLTNNYINQWKQKAEIKKEVAKLEIKKTEMLKANQLLEKNLKMLESSSYKAQIARNLNMKIEGEQVVIFPEDLKLVESPAQVPLIIDTQANYKKWWKYFFDPKI